MDATRAARLRPLPRHNRSSASWAITASSRSSVKAAWARSTNYHQESLDRDVAVKVLFKHLAANSSFVDRFQREARIMAKLDRVEHPAMFGVGEEHGCRFCAMEFIDGGSLQEWLDEGKH